jgi:hypothetical protein
MKSVKSFSSYAVTKRNRDSLLNIQRVTEISTLILTGNRTRHDDQFFYVPLFRNRQFFLTFSPP